MESPENMGNKILTSHFTFTRIKTERGFGNT